MKQLERLKLIYGLLSHSPQTIDSLQKELQALGTVVSSRQLYRDLDDVGNFFLRAEERLDLKNQEFNKKLYVINRNNGSGAINNYDIDTYLINKLMIPAGIAIGRKSSLDKFRDIFASHLNSSKVENNGSWDGLSMLNTHFNEIVFDQKFEDKFNQILWSVSNHRAIEIIECHGDSVSMYKSLVFPFLFLPMKIIYHRGGFFVAGMVDGSKKCLVMDLFQISTFKLSNQTFAFKKDMTVLDKNLQARFGVSQNIDDEVYEVALDFASVTGSFVQAHNWHHSQRFEVLSNGNVRIYLTCGINRELLGWIYMWMGNVKVVAPEILKAHHQEQLQSIIDVSRSDAVTYKDSWRPA